MQSGKTLLLGISKLANCDGKSYGTLSSLRMSHFLDFDVNNFFTAIEAFSPSYIRNNVQTYELGGDRAVVLCFSDCLVSE